MIIDLASKLINIGRSEGSKLQIDTPKEKRAARELLQSKYDGIDYCSSRGCTYSRDLIRDALYQIIANPSDSFSVSPIAVPSLPICRDKSKDCNRLLIITPTEAHVVLPIVSGAFFVDYLDYVPFDKEEWSKITESIEGVPEDASKEREALVGSVDKFEELLEDKFDVDDWGGWLGNNFPQRGEQDCVDESLSLISLFVALQSSGLVRFHEVSLNNPITSVGSYHHSLVMTEKGSEEEYVVDPWPGFTDIVSVDKWQFNYEIDQAFNDVLFSGPRY